MAGARLRGSEAKATLAPATKRCHIGVVSSFVVTSPTGQEGEAQTAVFAPTAQEALEIAESSGPGTAIIAPDRETYDVAEFRRALDAGKFSPAEPSGDGGRHAEPGG